MKYFFLSAVLASCLSCNSGKKEKTTEAPGPDTAGIIHPPDSATSKPEPVTGKIDIESFGDIRIGLTADETEKILGKPGSKSKAVKWEADGLMHEEWGWKDKGLVVNMSSDPENKTSPKVIASITANAGCPYKTKAGVGVGSTYDEIQAAYKNNINKEETGDDQIIIGSMYGGIVFTMKDNKVLNVFLGAAAE